MGPSSPSTSDERPDRVAPVFFNPTTANAPPPAESDELEEAGPIAPDTEERGVARAQLASLLSVVGIALLLLGPVVLLVIDGVALPFLGPLFGSAQLTIAFLEELLGLIVGGVVLQVVSLGVYGSSFGLLRQVDDRFRVPRALSLIGLIGFILLLLGVGALLGFIFQAVSCAAAGSATSCLDPGLVLASGISALVGSLLAFVGWIGLLVGLYRLGSRYESSLLKVSAILMILPVVNVVAPILAFVALRGVPRRFDLRASTQEAAPAS